MSQKQQTIAKKISCMGVGLHSGADVSLTLCPADEHTGILFRRLDVDAAKADVPARFDLVTNTMLGTTITNEHGVDVSTIEHLVAAIWGCGIDNIIIELQGPEIPIMDGSSDPFMSLIECAGIKQQDAPRKVIEVLDTIRVEDEDKYIEIKPAEDFSISLGINFDDKTIGQQQFDFSLATDSFKSDIGRARTFGFKHEVDQLRSMGLARGGSLDNAIVVDENGVMNEGGLRFDDEFVRHKLLDCIGDFYLAGAWFKGHFNAYCAGHKINNMVLRALFDNPQAWRYAEEAEASSPRPFSRTEAYPAEGVVAFA